MSLDAHPPSTRRRTRSPGVPAVALLLLASAACGDDPTRPAERIDASEATMVATQDAVVDAASRIVTQLDNTAGSATLQARLTELSSRLASRDPGVVADALARVRTALEVADRTGPTSQAPDRAVIHLTMAAVQRLLDE